MSDNRRVPIFRMTKIGRRIRPTTFGGVPMSSLILPVVGGAGAYGGIKLMKKLLGEKAREVEQLRQTQQQGPTTNDFPTIPIPRAPQPVGPASPIDATHMTTKR